MAQFFYGVRDLQGVRQSGVISATNAGEALTRLRERFPLVLRLDEVGTPGRGWAGLIYRNKIGGDDLLAFTHQLSSMLAAGLSFGAAMDILLLDKVHRAPMRRVLVDLAASVSEGQSFSQSLRNHPEAFPEMYVSLVEAGESSANLPEVLQRLATYLEKTMRARMELLSAMLYPGVVLVFGLVVASTILMYGSPILQSMYSAAGLRLPWLSQFFVSFGVLLKKVSPGLVIGGLVGALLVQRYVPRRQLKDYFSRILLSAGPFKELLMEAGVARSCRTLATLYGGGVPVLKALEMTANSAGNVLLKETFLKVRAQVAGGSNLSAPLLASPIFPPMASGMITAGEAAGSLPSMLDHLAEYYESRLDFAFKAFSRLIEPCLIVAVGVLIGIVVLALGLPFMNLVAVLH